METQSRKNPDENPRITEMKEMFDRMGSELEIQAELGKMELRDYLADAKPRIENIRRDLESTTGAVRDEMRLGLAKIEAKIESIEQRYLRV